MIMMWRLVGMVFSLLVLEDKILAYLVMSPHSITQ